MICSSLCPEAELYAKQGETGQREKPIGLPSYGRMPGPREKIKLSKREREIVRLMSEGKNPEEICQTLKITKGNYDVVWHRLKEKLRKNL
jgi:DNA-binding NarL/FixJ family response regulator